MRKLLLSLCFLGFVLPSFAGEDWTPEVIGPFGTLNNKDSSLIIGSDKAQDLLNVDITPGGKSVKKRKGYATAFTLTNATSPVHGVYDFYDNNGNEVSLSFNDRNLNVSVNGGSTAVIFSTGASGATYQCVDSAGFAYCANTSRTSLQKISASTSTSIMNVNSTGTLVAVTPERLVTAGFAEAPSRIDFSKANDFTTWVIGGLPTDPIQFTITSPGSKITHITYAHGRLYWFKESSFGYILPGPTLGDWTARTLNSFVGTLYNTSVFRDDILYFQGNDGHFYAWDGSSLTKLSRDIQGTISATQGRSSNAWTQTTSADFQTGVSTPTSFLSFSAVPNSVVIDTSTAIVTLGDTTATNFSSGTLTNLSSTVVDGDLYLSYATNEAVKNSKSLVGIGNYAVNCSSWYATQEIAAGSNFVATSVDILLKKVGSPGSTVTMKFWSSAGYPSVVLASTAGINVSTISATTVSTITFQIPGGVVVTSGQKYWVQLVPEGVCDASNYTAWEWDLNTVTTENAIVATSGKVPFSLSYRLNGRTRNTAGNIVSRPFDVGRSTNSVLFNWCELTSSASINGQTLTFETQTSSASNGTYTTLASVSTGSAPSSLVQKYIKYKATFAGDGLSTPVLSSVTINACFIPSYYSAVKNTPSLTAFDALGVSKIDNGGTHTTYMRSSNSSFATDANSPSWTPVSIGAIPAISTGAYIQFRDDFSITSTTQVPTLQDFTLNWFEGSASDKTYATYHDDAFWWSVASGAGATTNNKIIKYDFLNKGFLLYDIATNGFYIKSQALYFGSPSVGKVYKFGDVDNDDGAAINAYWKSKDFVGGNPFETQELANISILGSSIANSTVTVTPSINGNQSNQFNFALYNSTGSFKNINKNLPAGLNGSEYNVKFGNNAANQPFEIFGIQIGLRPKSWIPTP